MGEVVAKAVTQVLTGHFTGALTKFGARVAEVTTKVNAYFFDVEDEDGNATATDWVAVVTFYGAIGIGAVMAVGFGLATLFRWGL